MRTPSMSTAEAEALLGPRGYLRVDANNRATVRKWLTAQGFPALFAGGLSMTELAIAYNHTDGSGVEKLRQKLADCPQDEPSEPAASTSAPTPRQQIELAQEFATNGATHSAAGTLEAAIRAIAG